MSANKLMVNRIAFANKKPNRFRKILHFPPRISRKDTNFEIWNRETVKICNYAANYLLNRKVQENEAVIFDIDGTLVADEFHCILPVKRLYEIALNKGYNVFIVTARANTIGNQIFTSLMLERCGIDRYQAIFMRPPEDLDLYEYKRSRRKHIFEMGFNSLMSVGDMSFDFGEYGGQAIRIPTLV